MSTEVKVPAVGESISSGLLSEWHKKDGDTVETGEILFTLETDKVSSEVNATESGTLSIQVPEGEEVKIGQVVATIAEGAAAPKKDAAPAEPTPEPPEQPEPASKKPPAPEPPAPSPTIHQSPVTSHGEAPDPRTSRKKLSPLRRKIATQLVAAQQTAAILTTFNECDMSAIMSLRKTMQEGFVKRHGIKLGFMSFFIKATVDALQAVPGVNSRLEGDTLITNLYHDIGVAVGTEKGLMVPVVRDCDQKSFAEIEQSLADYAAKAREGKIGLPDLQGGVFTISNGGVYGSLMSTPILNPPQSGILGMHTIQDRPVARDGQVVIRPMMYLALSYDHRVVDGKEAVTFLVRVKDCIENPLRLLLGS
jgi:2-oxoglutarate dehydrogenase E2 component (dihydrolipoamide succinyltransferase)